MKKMMFLWMAAMLFSVSASAQYYPYGRYNSHKSHSRYVQHPRHDRIGDSYGGLRLGLSLANVNSDSPYLDGNKMRAGVVAGLVGGTRIAGYTPLYLEAGVLFSQKGGKCESGGEKFTYTLDYLEVPLVFKYIADLGGNVTIEPFVGGYAALGVGGKIKDYQYREAYSSFGDKYNDNFKRFDGGIRVGCGFSFDQFYLEGAYDFGLANVGKDAFDDTHTGAFNLTLGMNF